MRYAIAAALTLLALAAAAGVRSDRAGGTVEVASTKTDPQPSAAYTPPAKRPSSISKGPSLRCWQYGRLIFEEPVSEVPATLGGAGHKFEGRSGNLQLVDMHNSSCLIK